MSTSLIDTAEAYLLVCKTEYRVAGSHLKIAGTALLAMSSAFYRSCSMEIHILHKRLPITCCDRRCCVKKGLAQGM